MKHLLSVFQISLFFLISAAFYPAQVRGQISGGEPGSASQSEAAKSEGYKLWRGDNEFAVWAAGSFDAPTPIGSTYRPVTMLGVRYGRIVGTNHLGALEYVADIIPLQLVFDQKDRRATRSNVYGVGINYGGLKVSYLRRSRVKPFAVANGGILIYTRAVPLEGRKLNFTYSLGAGLDIFTRKKRAISLGYKFYHASDAVNRRANIGTNDNMLSIGFSFYR